jgi:putative sterol carrier protein
MSITIRDVFEAIPTRFNGDEAGDWKATIQFDFEESSWVVDVGDGGCNVTCGTAEHATATVKTSEDTWIGMILGTVNPMQAFMSGKLTVGGNLSDVMKLQDQKIFPRTQEPIS